MRAGKKKSSHRIIQILVPFSLLKKVNRASFGNPRFPYFLSRSCSSTFQIMSRSLCVCHCQAKPSRYMEQYPTLSPVQGFPQPQVAVAASVLVSHIHRPAASHCPASSPSRGALEHSAGVDRRKHRSEENGSIIEAAKPVVLVDGPLGYSW